MLLVLHLIYQMQICFTHIRNHFYLLSATLLELMNILNSKVNWTCSLSSSSLTAYLYCILSIWICILKLYNGLFDKMKRMWLLQEITKAYLEYLFFYDFWMLWNRRNSLHKWAIWQSFLILVYIVSFLSVI